MDQHSSPQSETLQTTNVLEFRVSRPGVATRRLRLTGNRYTFGRDPAATVRLNDFTLQPVHAILLREVSDESERLVLQSTGLPLSVNGRLTTEAALHTGDTFQLGEFQFEFIGVIDVPPASRPEQAEPAAPAAELSASDDPAFRADGKSSRPAPRLSFAAGMRLVDQQDKDKDDDLPLRPERTLDAIEQALSSEPEHRREMESVLQRFAESQQQAASANRAIESMREQVADLGRQLRHATETQWEHQQALDRAGKQRDAAHDELRQASAKSQRLISELDAARRDRTEISSSLHDMTIQLYTATAEGDKAQARARELARQREEALEKVESFARRCEELTAQLQQAEQTCQTVSDQRDQFAEQLRQRTAERDSAQALAEQRNAELTAKESVIDGLRSQVSELEQAIAESRREAESLRTECQAACESVAKLEGVVREGEQQRLADRESWEAESAELRVAVEQIGIELAAASSELTRSNETADALNAELAETREALSEAESEVAMRPSVDDLQAIRERLEATERQLNQLQAETGALENAPQPDDEGSGDLPETAADGLPGLAWETPQETPQEAGSDPSPWGVDANRPWNVEPAALTAPDQEHQEGSCDPVSAQDAGEPAGEEPAAGSFASELLKQLNESSDRAEQSATEIAASNVDSGWEAHETPYASIDQPDADALESFGGDFADAEPASQVLEGYGEEPEMQEQEIEQVREFLGSNDAPPDEDAEQAIVEEAGLETAATPAAVETDEEDDSIEAYMNRLLQRVQGGGAGAEDASPEPQKGSQGAAGTANAVPAAGVEQPPIDEDAPFVPRSQAPERSKNLAAMRELANNSARTAIMSSVRKQTYTSALQKFGQAAACAVGASVMLYFSHLQFGWQMLATICMTLLAAYWGVEALQLQARLRTETERESVAVETVTESEQAEETPEADAAC